MLGGRKRCKKRAWLIVPDFLDAAMLTHQGCEVTCVVQHYMCWGASGVHQTLR
jgi:hypothetical protein